MEEQVFTNPERPKVTCHHELSGPGRLGSFHCEVATHIGRHQCIIRQGMAVGESFSCPAAVSEVIVGAAWRGGQILKNSLRVLMDRFADQNG